MPELADWDNFYLIVGGASGALIGLQFVVITLLAERPRPNTRQGAATYATPTIVHFTAVLVLSALLVVPWQRVAPLVTLWAAMGVVGIAYTASVAWHMRKVAYTPVLEDWTFHVIVPFAAYAGLAVAAASGHAHLHEALFGVGAAALLLLVAGIHNAWDTAAYHVLGRSPADGQ